MIHIDLIFAAMFVAATIYSFKKGSNQSVSFILCAYFLVALGAFHLSEANGWYEIFYFPFVGVLSTVAAVAIFVASVQYEKQENVKFCVCVLTSISIIAICCAIEEGRGYVYLYNLYGRFMLIADSLLLVGSVRGVNGIRRKRLRNRVSRYVKRISINRNLDY